MPYIPPHVRRGAAERGISVEKYMANLAAEKAAAEEAARPRNVGEVRRHAPGGGGGGAAGAAAAAPGAAAGALRRSSSSRRKAGHRVRMTNRRLRVNLNTGHGVNEVHAPGVEPNEFRNTRGANYRVTRRGKAIAEANMPAYAQRVLFGKLGNVMGLRATVGAGGRANASALAAINAALDDLKARAALNASNAMAITALGERIRELMDTDE
jgi:hypothetical protein